MTREEMLLVAKPILFNTEMVCKVLDGTKTATRRVVKPQPTHPRFNNIGWLGWEDGHGYKIRQPYRPGDILYVRETWRRQPLKWSREGGYSDFVFQYRADFTDEENDCYGRRGGIAPQKWHPSIHMPKEAARIFLQVTGVKVCRLQDITEEQAKAEGAVKAYPYIDPATQKTEYMESEYGDYLAGFECLWNSTIKPADRSLYGWEANPWVWSIDFKRVEAEQ